MTGNELSLADIVVNFPGLEARLDSAYLLNKTTNKLDKIQLERTTKVPTLLQTG